MKLISKSEVFTHLKTLLMVATLLIASFFNAGCSSLSLFSPAQIKKSFIEIFYSSPDRISFQGKGAGAGIALMLLVSQ